MDVKWPEVSDVTVLVFGYLIYELWKYSGKLWFWGSLSVLCFVHIAICCALVWNITQWRFLYFVPFGMAEIYVIVLALETVRERIEGRR